MEVVLGYRKRKHQSSKSGGNFTRSKSQIHVQRHRSGYARADSVRACSPLLSLERSTKSLAEQDPWGYMAHQITSEVSVKDLRAKRIFSPMTILEEDLTFGAVDSKADLDVIKTNDGIPDVPSLEGDSAHCDLGVSCSVAFDLKPSSQNIKDSFTVSENNFMEADEFVMTTPKVPESPKNMAAGENNGIISASNEIVDTQASMSKIQLPVTSSRTKKKVFINRGSYNSYRRLLPYLTNPETNDSPNFEIVEATMTKSQKSSTIVPDMVASKYNNNAKRSEKGSTDVKSCSSERNDSDSASTQVLQSRSIVKMLKNQQNIRNSLQKTTVNKKSDSPTSTLTPVKSPFKSNSKSKMKLQPEVDCSMKLEQESESPIKELKCVESTNEFLLQIAPPNSPLINGILKRTSRGCRGICNCLNCTSFRLNADRCFKFSRNQMNDAEEVALELINDLNSLRNILERTVTDSNDNLNHEKVKEVLEKALYKEEVAKARLAKLNEDLSYHYRSMEK